MVSAQDRDECGNDNGSKIIILGTNSENMPLSQNEGFLITSPAASNSRTVHGQEAKQYRSDCCKGTPSPKVIYPVVDVRDLADLHILAMEKGEVDGQRFIAESEEMTMPEMARLLKCRYPERKVSSLVIPDFLIGIMAWFQPQMKVLNTLIGLKYHYDNTNAVRLLGWKMRSAEESVIDTAEYLIGCM